MVGMVLYAFENALKQLSMPLMPRIVFVSVLASVIRMVILCMTFTIIMVCL